MQKGQHLVPFIGRVLFEFLIRVLAPYSSSLFEFLIRVFPVPGQYPFEGALIEWSGCLVSFSGLEL